MLAFPRGVYWERERLARTPSEPSYSETVLTLSHSVGGECICRYTFPRAMELATVGLGRMSGTIARRLVRRGHQVFGYSRARATVDEYIPRGVIPTCSLQEFGIDLAAVAEAWRHGTVIRSWLLDLIAGFLQDDQQLSDIAPYVADSGEGRWTAHEAIDLGSPAPLITLALHERFRSQDSEGFQYRFLAQLRRAFGGHAVKSVEE